MIITSNSVRGGGPLCSTVILTDEGKKIHILAEKNDGHIVRIELYGGKYHGAYLGHQYYALIALSQHILYLQGKLDQDVAPVKIYHHIPTVLLPDEHYRFTFPRYDCKQSAEYVFFSDREEHYGEYMEQIFYDNATLYVLEALALYIIEQEPQNIEEPPTGVLLRRNEDA